MYPLTYKASWNSRLQKDLNYAVCKMDYKCLVAIAKEDIFSFCKMQKQN